MIKGEKVLIVLPSDALGGAEQFLKMMAKLFLEKGNKVYVVFLKRKKFLGWRDIEAHPNASLFFTSFDSERMGVLGMMNILNKLRRNKFDYVFSSHVHLTGFLGTMIGVGLVKKKKFIGRESTSIFKRFVGIKLTVFKLLYKLGYSKLDLLICQTEFMKKQLVEALPKLAQTIKIKVIANPLNLADIEIRSKQDIDVSPFGQYLVAAGRLIHLKGYDLLIKALGQLNRRSLNLVILGKGSEEESLRELISRENLQERVFLLGQVENVFPYFKNAKCCVVSSRIEGFPNVLLQMMSQNHKVVSTLCAGGIEDIPGIFTCKTNDMEALATALENALENDTKENIKTFDHFLKERSIDRFVKKVEELVMVEKAEEKVP